MFPERDYLSNPNTEMELLQVLSYKEFDCG